MFQPVSSKVSFPELEDRTLQLWRDRDVFRRTWSEGEGKPLFMLYEGPPTTNGTPGMHHVLARVFKDVIPRYKTMRGYRPFRKGGWDTHGLPVELEVEKELGFTTKGEIEEYGIDRFNALCRESVQRYKGEWEDLTERVGFWIDLDDPYVTFHNGYIQTGWWIIKELWDRGLVYLGYRVTPHCPRCVTSLSSHEVSLGYKDDTPDPSIYVRFPLTDEQDEAADAARRMGWSEAGWDVPVPSAMAWTTTPWTLTANMALAVAPNADYALLRSPDGGERLLLARARVEEVLGEGWTEEASFKGIELQGLRYSPPFANATEHEGAPFHHRVPAGRLRRRGRRHGHRTHGAGLRRGGLRPRADVRAAHVPLGGHAGRAGRGLPRWRPLREGRGPAHHGGPGAARAALSRRHDAAHLSLLLALRHAAALLRQALVVHPHDGAQGRDGRHQQGRSTGTRATSRRGASGTGCATTSTGPSRVSGTGGRPSPSGGVRAVARTSASATWTCCESVRRQRRAAALDEDGLDLHRPYIDTVVVTCQSCGGEARRTPEVLDCWFDSGAMPYAQFHFPKGAPDLFSDGRFPADYICEGVDQTRGWFYSLHALSVLLRNEPSYRNVICLGLILDGQGEKMSKTKGNIVEPWAVINAHGADAVRWCLLTAAPPGNSRRFSQDLVEESVRRFLLTLWNTYSFFITYARLDGFDPMAAGQLEPAAELDRWALSELNQLVADVTEEMDGYNPTDAGRKIEAFVEELSTWYVRRSRRRFWKSENDTDKRSAYQTLYTCLVTLSKLLAPLTPFLAEEMYQNLVVSVDPDAPDSVHLTAFPEADEALIDQELAEAVQVVMRVVSMGRAARSKSRVKVRQPLSEAVVMTRSAGRGRRAGAAGGPGAGGVERQGRPHRRRRGGGGAARRAAQRVSCRAEVHGPVAGAAAGFRGGRQGGDRGPDAGGRSSSRRRLRAYGGGR